MADAPKKDDAKSLPDRLVSDPKSPPELSLLQGWLGASSEDRHRRLYLDPELSQSLEIPEDAIVNTQDMPRESNPLGGSWVWVKADAAIKQGPGIERLYARFLRGQIQQDFFAAGGGGLVGAGNPALGAAAAIPTTNAIVCQLPPTIVGCPTRQTWCRPSVFTICPTRTISCQSRLTICVSQFVNCPSQTFGCQATQQPQCVSMFCPSIVDGCPSAPGGCFDQWTNPAVDPAVNVFAQGLGFDPGAGFGLPGAPAAAAANPVVAQIPPTVFNCPTRQVWCQPSVFTICPTRTFVCQSRLTCPSVFTICPTQPPACQVTGGFTCNTRICPSIVDGCPSTPGGCFDPAGNPAIDTAVNVFAQGLGFDPGAGFGLPGAPAAAAANPAIAQLQPTIFNCPTRFCTVLTPCPTQTLTCPTRITCPSQLTICPSRFGPTCPNSQPWICQFPTQPPACLASAGFTCNTRICPSAVDGCPSAPGGCFDPGLNPAINPAVNIGQGPAFDPGAAFGLVGAPPPPPTSPNICQFQPTIVGCPTRQVWCQPSVFTICPTTTLQCQSRFVLCQSQFTLCRTQFNCPTLSPACLVTAGFTCNTRICPSAVDGCPSAPGGCFDPWVNPAIDPAVNVFAQGPAFDPGAGFGGGGFAGGLVGAQVTMVWPPCTPSAFGPCQTRFGCGGGPWM